MATRPRTLIEWNPITKQYDYVDKATAKNAKRKPTKEELKHSREVRRELKWSRKGYIRSGDV
jgi:hypothetical protein